MTEENIDPGFRKDLGSVGRNTGQLAYRVKDLVEYLGGPEASSNKDKPASFSADSPFATLIGDLIAALSENTREQQTTRMVIHDYAEALRANTAVLEAARTAGPSMAGPSRPAPIADYIFPGVDRRLFEWACQKLREVRNGVQPTTTEEYYEALPLMLRRVYKGWSQPQSIDLHRAISAAAIVDTVTDLFWDDYNASEGYGPHHAMPLSMDLQRQQAEQRADQCNEFIERYYPGSQLSREAIGNLVNYAAWTVTNEINNS